MNNNNNKNKNLKESVELLLNSSYFPIFDACRIASKCNDARKPELAIQLYNKALSLLPNDLTLLGTIIEFLHDIDDKDSAQNLLNQAYKQQNTVTDQTTWTDHFKRQFLNTTSHSSFTKGVVFITQKNLLSSCNQREKSIVEHFGKTEGVSIYHIGPEPINIDSWDETKNFFSLCYNHITSYNLGALESELIKNNFKTIYINDESLLDCAWLFPEATSIIFDISASTQLYSKNNTAAIHRLVNNSVSFAFENKSDYIKFVNHFPNSKACYLPHPITQTSPLENPHATSLSFIGQDTMSNIAGLKILSQVLREIKTPINLNIFGSIIKNKTVSTLFDGANLREDRYIIEALKNTKLLIAFLDENEDIPKISYTAIKYNIPVVIYSLTENIPEPFGFHPLIIKSKQDLSIAIDTLLNFDNDQFNLKRVQEFQNIKLALDTQTLRLDQLINYKRPPHPHLRQCISTKIHQLPLNTISNTKLELPIEVVFKEHLPVHIEIYLSYNWNDQPSKQTTPTTLFCQLGQNEFELSAQIQTPHEAGVYSLYVEIHINEAQQTYESKLIEDHTIRVFDKDKSQPKNILFCLDDLRAETFYAVAQKVSTYGHNVTFCTQDINAIYSKNKLTLGDPIICQTPPSQIQNFHNIDFIIIDDVSLSRNPLPPGVKCISIQHSLAEYPDQISPADWQRFFFGSDYILLSNKIGRNVEKVLKHIDKAFPKELTRNRDRELRIIPGGYPKIDLLRESFLKSKIVRNAFLYAPSTKSLQGIKLAETKEICLQLIKKFPDREVIYRPYPDPGERRDALKIVQELKQYKNFTYDTSHSAQASQLRSEIIITDASSIALSYSFATYTPHIRVIKSHNTINTEIHEDDAWYEIGNIEHLYKVILLCLDKKEYWKSKIEKTQYEFLYNPGNAINNIARQINNIANEVVEDSWFSLYRSYPDIKLNTEEAFLSHIKKYPYLWTKFIIRDLMIKHIRNKYKNADKLITEIQKCLTGEPTN